MKELRDTTFPEHHITEAVVGIRSSKGVFKNFANLTGKHLCWRLFSIICVGDSFLQVFRPAALLKKENNKGVFL